MKKSIGLVLLLLAGMQLQAEERKIASPDGKLVVVVSDEGGKPAYTINYNGNAFLEKSPLGLLTNIGNFTQEMSLTADTVLSVDQTYSLPNIKKSNVRYVANEGRYTFSQKGKKIYDIIFSVGNNDVALKYKLFPQGNTFCCVVEQEATGFVMPDGTTTFLCPQSKPMNGFARTSPSYETPYTVDDAMGKNGWGEGYTFPCLFRNNDKGWILISETGVGSNYCGSRLLNASNGLYTQRQDDNQVGIATLSNASNNLYTIGFPQAGEFNGNGTSAPGLALPGETPWRTITLGENLAPIVETTVAFDVVSPLYESTKKFQYGCGTWSWIIGMDGSCNYDEQKRYIDFTNAMGYKSLLVDALWDQQIGRDKIAELSKYAQSKGVALYLWYNSNGYWNDAPQSPRGIMDNTIARRKEMKWMQSVGIRGIKVDFFGSDKQETMKLYEDILADANDYGLLVIFHGCTLPRGWEKMYPNYAASEAVLASENLHFSQGSCDAEAFNACIHPFVRNTVGSMDFGGSALNKYYNANNNRGSKRMTSDVFALATAVLFQSPVQHFALAPNNLTDAPAWAIDFMKAVPTTWDDVKFIDGYPGRYVIFARKHNDKWYVAGVNASKETLKLNVKLPMLKQGAEVSVYSDDANLAGSLKTQKVNKKQEMQITIPCNGGFVAVQ